MHSTGQKREEIYMAAENLCPGLAQMLSGAPAGGAGHVWVSDDRGAGTALQRYVRAEGGRCIPSLHALEADGIESQNSRGAATAGKPRRYYRITRAGVKAEAATEWRRQSRRSTPRKQPDARAGVVL